MENSRFLIIIFDFEGENVVIRVLGERGGRLYTILVLLVYIWPYAILLPFGAARAPLPLSLLRPRCTEQRNAYVSLPSTEFFQISSSEIGSFFSRLSMFFSFIITPVFLVHKTQFVILLLISWTSSFLQNFVSYISTCTWTQSESCHHKNIDALNVCTFACALTLKIRNDYTFHNV